MEILSKFTRSRLAEVPELTRPRLDRIQRHVAVITFAGTDEAAAFAC